MVLEKYARKTKESKDAKLNIRLEQGLYDIFVKHCKRLGLTTSEAIRLLIIEELTSNSAESAKKAPIMHTYDTPTTYGGDTIEVQKEDERNTNVIQTTDKETTKGTAQRITKRPQRSKPDSVVEWLVNNQLPCPVCQRWQSRSNYSRHAKGHGYDSSAALLRDPQYVDVVKRMMEQPPK